MSEPRRPGDCSRRSKSSWPTPGRDDRDPGGAAIKSGLTSILVVVAVGLTASVLGSCGSSDDAATSTGGAITISQTSQPDYLDPALSYTINGWEPMWLVYTPLLTYRHEEGAAGAELIPGLAEDLPAISADGRTYTLTLREGLEYSDGSAVEATDFEHTIKRVLNLESGGAPFYLAIEGADEYLSGRDPNADITGIEADDRSDEITIELLEPDAAFSNVLAMNFAGLVPGDTPFRNLTQEPPPGVGPYRITESIPNREFVIERVERFADLGIPEIPAGHVDTITTKIVKSAQQQAQDVLDNELDYMLDPPPSDLVPTIEERAGERYEEQSSSSTSYFFLNTEIAPFDDPLVREAVNYGTDRPALARLFGGRLAPGCSFLPPGMPGYDEGLDTTDCPYGDPTRPPDLDRARELIVQAGAEGAEVTVWGNNDGFIDELTEAFADMLNQIGLDAKPRIIDGGVYYQTIGNEETAAQTGFSDWLQDFPHPLNFYFLFDGETIQPTNNQNLSNVDDPKINAEIDRLGLEADTEAVADEWAELDRYLISPPQSYLVAYGHDRRTTFTSDRIDFDALTFHPLYLNDYTSFRLLEEGG